MAHMAAIAHAPLPPHQHLPKDQVRIFLDRCLTTVSNHFYI